MKLVRVTGWAREKVKSDDCYLKWLASLGDQALIAIQEFQPAGEGLLPLPFECWQYTCGRVYGQQVIVKGDVLPLDRDAGYLTYHGGGEWGKVFPARIVPLHSELGLQDVGDMCVSDTPMYEPHFIGATRHLYLVEHCQHYGKVRYSFKQHYPRHYLIDCNQGCIAHCFSSDFEPLGIEGATYLYSRDLVI